SPTTGVPGVEDMAPYFSVPLTINLSDATPSDTLMTSSSAWWNLPLWHLAAAKESRLDIEGPVTVTLISLAPVNEKNVIPILRYRFSVRLDKGAPATILQTARIGNPLSVRGGNALCGMPQSFEVQVPAGRHSVYFKIAEGDF